MKAKYKAQVELFRRRFQTVETANKELLSKCIELKKLLPPQCHHHLPPTAAAAAAAKCHSTSSFTWAPRRQNHFSILCAAIQHSWPCCFSAFLLTLNFHCNWLWLLFSSVKLFFCSFSLHFHSFCKCWNLGRSNWFFTLPFAVVGTRKRVLGDLEAEVLSTVSRVHYFWVLIKRLLGWLEMYSNWSKLLEMLVRREFDPWTVATVVMDLRYFNSDLMFVSNVSLF